MRHLKIGIQSVEQPVLSLSGGQRQAVAVARAIAWGTRIVIMDEPTAALGVRESGMVLELIKEVRSHGLAVIMISHNLPEVFAVADRITVLRLGRTITRVRSAPPSAFVSASDADRPRLPIAAAATPTASRPLPGPSVIGPMVHVAAAL